MKTDKVFVRYEPICAEILSLCYRENEGEGKFCLTEEESKQVLRSDRDSRIYFIERLAENMVAYLKTSRELSEFIDEQTNKGWNEYMTDLVRDRCIELEGYWHNMECYQLVLGDLKERDGSYETDGLA